jgi:hypothetical protein
MYLPSNVKYSYSFKITKIQLFHLFTFLFLIASNTFSSVLAEKGHLIWIIESSSIRSSTQVTIYVMSVNVILNIIWLPGLAAI